MLRVGKIKWVYCNGFGGGSVCRKVIRRGQMPLNENAESAGAGWIVAAVAVTVLLTYASNIMPGF
ncbi:hypothetical protein l11_10200 [Neisseria weaveri LMG 5135]|nr:hypothetical protein l13_14900 [Neisseria weaveri ATCC 51223]EGV37779.1 hypothetical protein l11_10200 [Neisseria weaveri LMG 5135]